MNQWKYHNLLNEKLIPASLERLLIEMEKDEKFNILMTTKIGELDKKYFNLFPDEDRYGYRNYTLYQVILDLLDNRMFKGTIFFSEEESNEKKLKGLAVYSTNMMNTTINDLAIISFDLNTTPKTLFDDLKNLFSELLNHYRVIRFETNEGSFADKLYYKSLGKLGYTFIRSVKDNIAYFEVENRLNF